MNKRKAIALVAAGLVAGLTLGAFGIASAAPEGAPGERMGAKMGQYMRDAGARMIDVVADLTGLSTDEVSDRRQGGESVADIARDAGVDPAAVVDEVLDRRDAILDERVADGTITEEQAALMRERMAERMTERLEATETGGRGCGMAGGGRAGKGPGNGMGAGRGPGGGFGSCDGGSCGAAPATD